MQASIAIESCSCTRENYNQTMIDKSQGTGEFQVRFQIWTDRNSKERRKFHQLINKHRWTGDEVENLEVELPQNEPGFVIPDLPKCQLQFKFERKQIRCSIYIYYYTGSQVVQQIIPYECLYPLSSCRYLIWIHRPRLGPRADRATSKSKEDR